MSLRKREWVSPKGLKKTAWQVDYRDGAGIRRSKQFAKKKDADAWEAKTKVQVMQGLHTPDSQSVTVAKAGEIWVERARRDGLEPATVRDYDAVLRLHITPFIGSKRLSQLTKPMIEHVRDQLVDNRSRPMATRALRYLTMIIEEAHRRGLVAQNVAKGVKVRRSDRHKPPVIIPAKEELRAFLAAADASDKPMTSAFAYATVFTGFRASELRGLPWSAVDLKAGTISVVQRADSENKIGPPKTRAGRRTIPIPPKLISILREWKLRCPPSEQNLVFPSDVGTPIFYQNLINWVLEPLLAAAELTRPVTGPDGSPRKTSDGTPVLEGKYSMHDFRHAAASLWIEQRVDPKRIQRWMGHSSIQVTFDTYGHLFERAEAEAAIMRAMEVELLGPNNAVAANS